MIGRTPTEVVHKKPAAGGISATLNSGASYVSYSADDAAVVDLVDRFVTYDLPHIIPALSLQHFPVIWTVDFILGDKDKAGNDTYHVGACVVLRACSTLPSSSSSTLCGVVVCPPLRSQQCCGGLRYLRDLSVQAGCCSLLSAPCAMRADTLPRCGVGEANRRVQLLVRGSDAAAASVPAGGRRHPGGVHRRHAAAALQDLAHLRV